MSAWDSQSSQPVWPLGLALLEPPSGRRCQRDAGPAARPAPPYRHGGLPGSRPWGCGAWSPNNNALKWERGRGRAVIDTHAVVPFWLLFAWQEISRARYAQAWSFFPADSLCPFPKLLCWTKRCTTKTQQVRIIATLSDLALIFSSPFALV